MTSNIGSDLILQAKEITPEIKEAINRLLRQHFRPEFLNRIDAIIFFNSLTHKDIMRIVTLQIDQLVRRLSEKHTKLIVKEDVMEKLAELGYEKEFGARPLKRAIQHYLGVPVSQYILKHPESKVITATVQGAVITIK